MSRSGYNEDYDCWDTWGHIRWRGAVASGLRGARGQAFLKEAIADMEAMPVKALSKNSLGNPEIGYCTLGVVGAVRGMDMKPLEDCEAMHVADQFGISHSMAAEIMFMNDEASYYDEEPEARWRRMHTWLNNELIDDKLNAP